MGFFIGIFEGSTYENAEVEINEGDRILLFTDGIIEARNEQGEFYEYERLKKFIIDNSEFNTKDFVDKLINDVKNFCGSQPQDDDRAILCIEMVSKLSSDKKPEDVISIEARRIENNNKDIDRKEEEELLKNDYKDAINMIKSYNFDKAVEILHKLIEKYPENPKFLHSLGVSYYKLGKLREAKEVLEKALR